MKHLVWLLLLISTTSFGSAMMDCPMGSTRQFMPQGGFVCAPLSQAYPQVPADCIVCQQYYYQRQMQTNPWMAQQSPWGYNPYSPWWAQQGQVFYPNFNYPGAWQYPGMNAHHYPGQGGVFAAKPNVYVKNSGKLTGFKMDFDLSKGASFLATTPWLTDDSWEGLVTTDAFRVENVKYDYLFYDARLNHTQMQYRAGWCVDRERVVESMMKEIEALGFSKAAMKDFHEHWTEKIPQEPVYCVYPQYNDQLDAALPIKLTPEAPFTRVVFILVPHRSDERRPAAQMFPELPRNSHVPLRPQVKQGALHYLEWGVAFLDHTLIR